MKTIEYRVVYNGVIQRGGGIVGDATHDLIRVQARDINSGFTKALKYAGRPLGNGQRKEIAAIELWQIV